MANNKQPFHLCQQNFWAKNDNPIWLASSVRFFRNIEKYKFPGKLDDERRKQLLAILSKEIIASPHLSRPIEFKAEEMSGLEKEYLVEHFLSSDSFHQAHTGEAFIIDEPGTFLAALNIRDHVHMEWLDTSGDLENSWNHLVKIESSLGKAVNYSYSPKFGFLTADPYQCGSALQVNAYLQLSGLIHTDKINDILTKIIDESLSVTGLQGSPTEIIGDVVNIQNQYTVGLTEENIISQIRNLATKLMVEEHAARSHIKHELSSSMKDKISRAYGILIHSYQIEAVESLNAISLLKLGADVGLLSGMTHSQFNELFFNCRRAHLLCQYSDKVSQEEIAHKRAEFVHNSLKNLKLNFE